MTGSAGGESSSFMLWRDTGWGPVTAVLIIVALLCSLIPRRATVLAAALVSVPAIILIPVRGTTYNTLEAFGLNIGFGAGWYLLMLFTLAGCALSFVAFFRMRSRGPAGGMGDEVTPRAAAADHRSPPRPRRQRQRTTPKRKRPAISAASAGQRTARSPRSRQSPAHRPDEPAGRYCGPPGQV